MFEDANEDILHDVLGLGAASQDGVGDAEQECGVCLD
jgi:hypothetical protein